MGTEATLKRFDQVRRPLRRSTHQQSDRRDLPRLLSLGGKRRNKHANGEEDEETGPS
jgi:hypothetical protein